MSACWRVILCLTIFVVDLLMREIEQILVREVVPVIFEDLRLWRNLRAAFPRWDPMFRAFLRLTKPSAPSGLTSNELIWKADAFKSCTQFNHHPQPLAFRKLKRSNRTFVRSISLPCILRPKHHLRFSCTPIKGRYTSTSNRYLPIFQLKASACFLNSKRLETACLNLLWR